MRFSFLPTLGIVAVCPQPGAPVDILANLFPNDTGKDTPNAANHHGKAARASPLGVFQYPPDVPHRPYRWAQWLAGLHFPPPTLAPATAAALPGGADADRAGLPIEPSLRSAMAALRSRVTTRMALDGQLKGLSAGKGPSPLPLPLPGVAGGGGLTGATADSVELGRCVAGLGWVALCFGGRLGVGIQYSRPVLFSSSVAAESTIWFVFPVASYR